jgi:SNF2 family DNA or RNA helicase
VRKEGEKSSESLSAVSQDDTKQETYHHVRQLLKPLLLRRMKSDSNIGIYLPDRFEKKYFVNLSQVQLALYQSLVVRFKKELTLVSEAKDQNEVEKESRRRGLILSTLIRLRQVCSEPRLVIASLDPMLLGEHAALLVDTLTSDDKNDVLSTGKFAELRRILTEASISGEKVVVFSQFLGCLDTLFNLSSSLGLPTYRVDGSMPPFERTRSIDLFQSQLQTAVLVLSLKAGGVGLNLTSANHIVHFDRWWNPAVEDQASDRVYRIGQTRNVRVNHLIARGTIEEGIDRLLESKRDLARDILETSPRTTDQGHGVVNLSDDEILELMQP